MKTQTRTEQALTLREKLLKMFSSFDEAHIRRLEDENAALKQIIAEQDKQLNNLKLAYRESASHRAKLLAQNQVHVRKISNLLDAYEDAADVEASATPEELSELQRMVSLVDPRPEGSK